MRLVLLTLLLLFPTGLLSNWPLLNAWLSGTADRVLTGEPRPEARRHLLAALAADADIAASRLDRWQRSASEALRLPVTLAEPYSEQVFIAGDDAFVAVYRLDLQSPRTLQIVSTRAAGAEGGLVIDIFSDQRRHDRPLASFGPAPLLRRWPVPAAGTYLVRVQSTIDARGGFGFAIAERRVLDFPVATDSSDAVRSLFGADRDGGARQHHGIDIFAPRGTPVLAAADGVISRVATSPRGGLHIWHSALDPVGEPIGSLYYAHLDTVAVSPGTWVSRGQRIGGVGNSGNAITTPPHLHFGWYRRFQGPADPLPMVGSRRLPEPEPIAGHGLPRWLAVAAPTLNRRAGPGTGFPVVGTRKAGDLVQVAGVSGGWARVVSRRGNSSFVASALLTAPEPQPIALAAATDLVSEPAAGAAQIIALPAGERVSLLGQWNGYRLIRTAVGREGWVSVNPA